MKKTIKVISAVLAVTMIFCSMSFAVFAGEDFISVSFSAFDGEIIMPKQSIAVSDGEAEKFGYEMPENDHNGEKITGVTAFDVLVAAHELYYGDDFTAESAENYLVLVNGQIKLAFGKNASASSFAVNNDCLHDDVLNDLYGTYTGYGAAEARINSGDFMSYFFYRDLPWCMDYYAWFNLDNKSFITTSCNEAFDSVLTLTGYTFGWYSCNKDEDKNIIPLAGVDVYLVKDKEFSFIGKTDENGQINVKINEPGEYMLCAYGTAETDYDDVPVAAAWCDIEVTEKNEEPQLSLWQKIVNFIKKIFKAIAKFFGF